MKKAVWLSLAIIACSAFISVIIYWLFFMPVPPRKVSRDQATQFALQFGSAVAKKDFVSVDRMQCDGYSKIYKSQAELNNDPNVVSAEILQLIDWMRTSGALKEYNGDYSVGKTCIPRDEDLSCLFVRADLENPCIYMVGWTKS